MYKLVLFISLLFVLISCSDSSKSSFEFAGGTFKMALNNEPSTFVSREIRDVYSSSVLTQVMEGLVSLNPKDLKVQPQLAESWKISPDGLIYEG